MCRCVPMRVLYAPAKMDTSLTLDITRALKVSIHGLEWIEQCFTSSPTQYRLYGRRFLQGCPRIGDAHSDVLLIAVYAPLKQISNLLTSASTRHGNTLRIENTGSTSWKRIPATEVYNCHPTTNDKLWKMQEREQTTHSTAHYTFCIVLSVHELTHTSYIGLNCVFVIPDK